MDWYCYYIEQAKQLRCPDIFGHKDLYLTLCLAMAKSEDSTKDDLIELTKAYLDYEEELENESITRAV